MFQKEFSDQKRFFFAAFVYDGHGNAYIRCFYIGLKSAVSIGKNPKPGKDNIFEMIFMWVMWISGVFVFAILIGNGVLTIESRSDN